MLRQISLKVFDHFGGKQQMFRVLCSRNSSIDFTSRCEDLSIEARDQVLWVKYNRPKKFNALTADMYTQMASTFRQVNSDKSIKAVVLTGTGDYYCSGNDLTNFVGAMKDPAGPRSGMTKCRDLLYEYVDSLIDCEKLLISAVNGPAVGISVTSLALCDYIVASDKATFQTPFTALGQSPEACSSVTLPRIVGNTRATELLLLNMSWDAKKALEYGFINEVIPNDKLYEHLEEMLYGKRGIVRNCYPNSLVVSRGLINNPEMKEKLKYINKLECDAILELWLGKESNDALQKFYNRSKK